MRLPFNIYSIEDIDQWRKDFVYPLSMKVGEDLELRITDFLIKGCRELQGFSQTLYRIASKQIYVETYDLLMKWLMAESMRSRMDTEYIFTNHRCPEDVVLNSRSATYDFYLGCEDIRFLNYNLSYDNVDFARLYNSGTGLSKALKRFKTFLRIAGKGLRQNASEFVIHPNECTLRFIQQYLKSVPEQLYVREVFHRDRSRFKDVKVPSDIGLFVEDLKGLVRNVYRELSGKALSQKMLENYGQGIIGHFKMITFDYQQAVEYLQAFKNPGNLYTGTGGNYFTRVVSEAFRARKAKVYGFPHGGGLCHLVTPSLTFAEFATCDVFMCLAKMEKSEYLEHNRFINTIDFHFVDDLAQSKLCPGNEKSVKGSHLALSRISTIMYVVTGFDYDRFVYGGPGEIRHLHTQMQIIDFLLKFDRRIIFKNRPKTRYLGRNFNHFGYYQNRLEYTIDPFSKVRDQADLFVFEAVDSSALHEAMMQTKTPIILFYRGYPRMTELFQQLVAKRCYVVELVEDDFNRLTFVEKNVKDLFHDQ